MRVWILISLLASCLVACGDDGDETPVQEADGDWSAVGEDVAGADSPDAATPDTATPDAATPDVDAPDPVEDTAAPDTPTTPDSDTSAPDVVTPVEDTTEPIEDVAPPTEDVAEPDPEPTDNGVEINQTWIGGACDGPWDCSNADLSQAATCLTSGFPNGFCTQDCAQSGSGSWVCPDTDYGVTTGATTSRCITTADGSPTCTAECDFTLSPTGCRPGYACFLRSRHGEPEKIYPICLPTDAGGWPGEPAKGFDIGDACGMDTDCESLLCLQMPGGYCTKVYCEQSGCPSGSTCYYFENFGTACLDDCTSDSQCRENEGYTCDDWGSCWPAEGPVVTDWDPSVAAGDCASAWAGGLSPCDAVGDDYVVANKGARNMALCQGGQEVASFHMGLGFAPTGDKLVEGDGKTPEGSFYVAQLVPDSQYYKAFLLSYPDAGDAAWGYGQGLISAADKSSIESAQSSCLTPPQTTALGSYIEIHGEGGGQDWTWGCLAIENFELDQIWAVLTPGDTIVVKP
jgi:hypothetical protein